MALTTLPAAGAKLRASTLSALITELRTLYVRKSLNETVNNSSALQADDELTLPVAASSTYEFEAHFFYTSGTTPDFKFSWSAPASATLSWGGLFHDTAGVLQSNGNFSLATAGTTGGTGADVHCAFWGTLITSTTAGNFALSWAQNTANPSNTTLYAGSFMKLTLRS